MTSRNRLSAVALIAGSMAGLTTMALHPNGRDVVQNALDGGTNTLANAIHALALVAQPLLLAGTLHLTLTLRVRREVAVLGYMFFAMASIAAMIAAMASGFIAPTVASYLGEADVAKQAMLMNVFRYTGVLNQAFAAMYVLFMGMALLLWSGAMLAGRDFSRGLAVFGLVLGALLFAGMLGGKLVLDVHGFGLVVLGEAVWMTWAAARMWRRA
jgi:hypothetical protein